MPCERGDQAGESEEHLGESNEDAAEENDDLGNDDDDRATEEHDDVLGDDEANEDNADILGNEEVIGDDALAAVSACEHGDLLHPESAATQVPIPRPMGTEVSWRVQWWMLLQPGL